MICLLLPSHLLPLLVIGAACLDRPKDRATSLGGVQKALAAPLLAAGIAVLSMAAVGLVLYAWESHDIAQKQSRLEALVLELDRWKAQHGEYPPNLCGLRNTGKPTLAACGYGTTRDRKGFALWFADPRTRLNPLEWLRLDGVEFTYTSQRRCWMRGRT